MRVPAFFHGIGSGFAEGGWMLFDTFWALVAGFALSGAVQAFVSRARMQHTLGDHRPATIARASFFGTVSSSCSYAASALAKSLFAGGADFTTSIVFMVASTNLVVELGIVLWVLLAWQFAAAEFVGGAIMIALLAVLVPRVLPATVTEPARSALVQSDQRETDADPSTSGPLASARTKAGWSAASGYAIGDLRMLRKELVIGFAVAGFAAALVPDWFWRSLFTTGHGFWSSLENVVLGPFLALISFVCSIGNVPLAAALWRGDISFGGVMAFVFADLITLPLLAIYRKYYGARVMLRLLGTCWVAMSIAGLATQYIVRALHLLPTTARAKIAAGHPGVNATTVLDILAAVALGAAYLLYRDGRREAGDTGDTGAFARDVVCGMQVRKAQAPARLAVDGRSYFFCSDHCRHRFAADPASFGVRIPAPAAADERLSAGGSQ